MGSTRMRKTEYLLTGTTLFAIVIAAAAPAQGGPDATDLLRAEQLQSTLAAVADEVRPCVVAVRAFRRFDVPADRREGAALPGNSTGAPLSPMIPSVGPKKSPRTVCVCMATGWTPPR